VGVFDPEIGGRGSCLQEGDTGGGKGGIKSLRIGSGEESQIVVKEKKLVV